MGDVTMGVVVLAFFFVSVGYVGWCGRIIGPDPTDIEMGSARAESEAEDVPAGAGRR